MVTRLDMAPFPLLVLVLCVPTTGFQLTPGLARPSFGLARSSPTRTVRSRAGCACSLAAQVDRVRHTGDRRFGMSLMDAPPPYEAKDEAAKREFELNRGQAVDTLLLDYPRIFSQGCDFSIFSPEIMLRDTQGFSVEGLRAYKAFFSVVPTLVNVAFSRGEVSALLMDKYGIDQSRIKIRWRLDLYPRAMGMSLRDAFRWFDTNDDGVISNEEYLKGQARLEGSAAQHMPARRNVEPLVIEGISAYSLNAKGKITMHEIEVTSPTDYPFLEALRELVPVRSHVNGIPTCFSVSDAPVQEHGSASRARAALAHSGAVAGVVAGPVHLTTSELPSRWALSLPRVDAMARVTPLAATKTFPRRPEDDDGDKKGGFGQQMLEALGGKQLTKQLKLPKQCKTDYDCNEGGYNWPLICADFVFAKLCIDPDDTFGGGLGANNWSEQDLVQEPIPVRVEDGWLN